MAPEPPRRDPKAIQDKATVEMRAMLPEADGDGGDVTMVGGAAAGGLAMEDVLAGSVRADYFTRHLKPGAVLADRFEVLAKLGPGETGVVYKARDRIRG